MKEKVTGILMHLSYNMWTDVTDSPHVYRDYYKGKTLILDQETWDDSIAYAAECGLNTILIDLGDGVQYESHPEIAVEGAFSVAKLKEELAKIRSLGMTPLPKLNFSTSHDAWLGEYHKMVSTKIYYQVCKDLIHEVIDIFEVPPYFHLGLDEERAEEQHDSGSEFICYRRGNLLWQDLQFYFDCVKEKGVTPWIWADHFWYFPEEFVKRIPKDVVVSPWYYDHIFGNDVPNIEFRKTMRESFKKLAKAGYKVIPCGGNVWRAKATKHLFQFIKEQNMAESVGGYLATTWYPTKKEHKMTIKDCIYLTKNAVEEDRKNGGIL